MRRERERSLCSAGNITPARHYGAAVRWAIWREQDLSSVALGQLTHDRHDIYDTDDTDDTQS